MRVLGSILGKLGLCNPLRSIQNRIVTYVFCFFIAMPSAMAQKYVYLQKQLNLFPNTFNREINCITSDDHGFIWVGTTFGLFRFDGYNTDPIVYYNKDSGQLSPEIHDIQYMDKHIYLATNNGVYIVETGSTNYRSHRLPQSSNDGVHNLLTDRESGLWWLSYTGTLYNYNNKKTKKITLPFNIVYNIPMLCLGNTIWASNGNSQLVGIDKFSGNIVFNTTFNQFKLINHLTISPQKTLYLNTEKGIYELKPSSDESANLIYHKEFGDSIRNLIIKDDTYIMTKMDANIIHFDINEGHNSKKIIFDNKENNFFTKRMMWYNDQLLIPSRAGLGVVQINKNNFETIFPISNSTNGDSRGISEDANYIYLFTYNNIIRYHKKNKTGEIISNQKLISHGIYHENDIIWIASESKGLIQFNTKTFKTDLLFKNLPAKYQALVCITPLNKDTLIIGGYKHLFYYNKKTGKIYDIIPRNKLNQPLTQGHLRQIDTINKNTLMIATRDGLFKINLKGELIKEYGNQLDSSSNKNINCFWMNKRQQVWAGTSDGIIIYDSSGKQLTKINYQNGLAGNKIASMINDNKGNLWVGTFNGLSKISTSDLSIKNYYTEQGLPDNEFNHSSIYKTIDDEIIMGTIRGFISFAPNKVLTKQNINSYLIISKIDKEQNGKFVKELLTNEVKSDQIQLGKEITYLKLYFCRIPIQLFTEINFTYKIRNLIPQSVDITEKPSITLSDSEPGKFDIEINTNDATGSSGIFNKIIQYQVRQYFYVNKWFYFISTLFFLLLIIVYLYTLNLQKNQTFNTRNEIARDLHDEIGGSLTAISLYVEMLNEEKPPTKTQIESIQYTTRKLLISFRDSLWSLNTSSDTAQQFWDHIKDMVGEITGNLDIDISFDEPEGLSEIIFTLNVKRNLLLAIKEGLNNALKHGDKKNITLKWVIINRKHYIVLTNTVLEHANNNLFTISNGIGLNSMQKRLEDIGGKINYQIKGTQFSIEYQLNFIV